ncbi:hypothetical protein GCM10023238_05540 [Streptomyces heliomycini]
MRWLTSATTRKRSPRWSTKRSRSSSRPRHNEAWEILVENRDVLDNLVLALLERETLGKEEIAEIFAPIVKRPPRPAWTGSSRRTPSTRPPVLSPKELALTNGANGATPAITTVKNTTTDPAPAPERTPEERPES